MAVETNFPISSEGEREDLSGYNSPEGTVLRWIKEIDLVLNNDKQRTFEQAGERIVRDYKNVDNYKNFSNPTYLANDRVMYNVLWANIQILFPMLFARMPEPVVERWYKDHDPIGRQAAEIAECCTSFQMKTQQDRFMYAVKGAVLDRLLPGRGQVWLRFEAEFIEALDDAGNPILDADGEPVKKAKPNSERVVIDPLMWQDYIESLARNQYEVRWRAKRAYMTRAELMDRFGEKGKECKLQNFKEQVDRRRKLDDEEQFLMQAEVWEIEDFPSKTKYWIARGYKKGPLDEQKNPLNISDFFSCPIPLLATTTSDSTYPTPDFVIYERLASEVDWAMKRRSSIFECVRLVGATSAAYHTEVKNMLKLNDGDLWPIKNWAKMVEDKGFAGIIDWMPFDQAVAALGPMSEYIDDCLRKIDAITGVPDFAHGIADPNESVASIQKRSQFTQPKIALWQQDVQRFCREITRKSAEIIFEPGLFSDDTIGLMYGLSQRKPEDQQTFPEALALLRDDRMRTFRVDIETDSTIATDEADNQARWAQYMQSVTGWTSNIEQITQWRPELMQPMIESSLAAVRSLRTGRRVESSWERAFKNIEDADMQAKMNPQPPPPDPAIQIEQMRQQGEQAKVQAQMQVEQGKLQVQTQKDQAEIQYKFQDLNRQTQKDMAEYEVKMADVQTKGAIAMNKAEIDRISTDLETFKTQYTAQIENRLVELKELATKAQIQESQQEETRLAIQTVADLGERKLRQDIEKDTHFHDKGIEREEIEIGKVEAQTKQLKVKNDAKKLNKPKI